MFELILFDMDQTLLDSEEITLDATAEVLAQEGFDFSGEIRHWSAAHAWDQVVARLYRDYPLQVSRKSLLERVLDAKYETMERIDLPLLPGARQAIQTCLGIAKVGIVSGSFHREVRFLADHLGVTDKLAVMIGGDDIPKAKPDPASYLLACEQAGVSPSNALAFEDAPIGIEAARAAGVVVYGVQAGNRYGFDQSGAHGSVRSLEAIDRDWLQAAWRKHHE